MLNKSDLISAVHRSGRQAVIAVTGGGSLAISDLLTVPGASAFVLEASVPYGSESLTQWLGRRPENFCARETALAMAAVAFQKGRRLGGDAATLIGVGCTASLASHRPKLGEHRAWIATQTADRTELLECRLSKGARDRLQEERLVADLLLGQIASGCAVISGTESQQIDPPFRQAESDASAEARPADQFHCEIETAEPTLAMLWNGARSCCWSLPALAAATTSWSSFDAALTASSPRGLLCGAFNPLHDGHRELARVADQIVGGPVAFEMSIVNVDKPPLDYLTIAARRKQFSDRPLVLTTAPTFAEKSRLFAKTTFIVGIDTAERIVQPKYYLGNDTNLLKALDEIRANGCRFLVAGRLEDGRFQTLADTPMPDSARDLFTEIPERAFRCDLSSTELRQHLDQRFQR
jgi:nicotinamide mononucleotide (NMN) deamidase PncC